MVSAAIPAVYPSAEGENSTLRVIRSKKFGSMTTPPVESTTAMPSTSGRAAATGPGERASVRLLPSKLWHTFGYASDGPYWAFQKVKEVVNVPGTGVDRPLYKFSQRYTRSYHGAVMLLFLGSLLGALVLRFKAADRHRLPAVGLVFIAYTALLSMVFFGNPRFAFPVLPFICMHAAWLLVLASRSLVAAQTGSSRAQA